MPIRWLALPTVAAASCAFAQGSATATGAAPVQRMSPVFVTGSPLGSSLFELVEPSNLLQGRELLLKQQPTLGATLEQEVGVSATSFGPNASRPIIRGLGGFDVRMLNNGLGVLDASSASPDHATAVSPFAVERIEVVRGPATVMYGGSAIGGVVNTIDSRIAQQQPPQPTSGSASVRYDSQSELKAGGARIDGGNDRFALHADAYATRNSDLRIPGNAWTSEVQAQRGEAGPSGTLPNSQADSQTYGVGGTLFLDRRSYAGLSYSRFTTNYGTVAEPDVTIDLKQQAWNFAGELRDTVPGFNAVRLKFGHTDYRHTEFEGSEPGTMFESKGWNLRIEGVHAKLGAFDGAVGLEAAGVDFSALGDEAFVPSTKTRSIAGFVFEETRRDPWKFSFGGRMESVKIDAQAFEVAGLPPDSKSFTPWSAAAGTFLALNPEFGIGINLQYTQRAPSSQELFADGPHVATNQFEVGDRALDKVASTSVDVTLKHHGERASGSLGAFYSKYSNFIALFPTGIFRVADDRSVAPGPAPFIDPVTGEEITPIEQFNYGQVRARFYGFEAQGELTVWNEGGNEVSLKLQADYVNAANRDTGQPLPFIPPLRVGGSVTWKVQRLTSTLGALATSSQDRVPQFQTRTPGYTNLYFNASYQWSIGDGAELEVFLQGTNLLDDTIRYSTSSLKDIAPAGGRAVMAGVRGAF